MRGCIGMVSGGQDPTAKLIRWVTRSPVHHIVIGVDDETCISAEPDGVRRMPIRHYPHIEWLPPQGTPAQLEQVVWHAENMCGSRYNNHAFILAGLDALRLIPRWASQPLADWADDYGVTCSGLADLVHTAAGIDLFDGPSLYTFPAEFVGLGATWHEPSASAQPQAAPSLP